MGGSDGMDVLRTTGYHPRPPFLVAREQGFFAREGLEIDFHVTTYAPDHNAGMAVGKWDFTLSSADTMMARVDSDGTAIRGACVESRADPRDWQSSREGPVSDPCSRMSMPAGQA